MKKLLKKIKFKGLYLYGIASIFFYQYLFPVIVWADARSEAEKKFKSEGSGAINSIASITQWLGAGLTVIAVIASLASGQIYPDEGEQKKAKKVATWAIIIGFLIGVSSYIVAMVTNKNV